MSYKPLSDEELDRLIEFYKGPPNRGVNTWLEQCRRANKLAEAVYAWDFYDGPWTAVAEALAAYLGEQESEHD